jgi:hypothetical protein
MNQMPGHQVRPTRPQQAYRPPQQHRHRHRGHGRRRGTVVGLSAVAVIVGLTVAVGAVSLTSGSGKPLAAATGIATPGATAGTLLQASASPVGSMAMARMPASSKPSPTVAKTTAAPTPSPSSPTASASPSASAFVPQATAEYQTPTGENQKVWSEAILTALGAPLTAANIVSIGYWMQNEAGSPPYGIVGANNPINVSQACCGGVPIQSDGDGVTFLQSYPTAADGVEAIAQYLNRGNYTQILAALQSGAGLMNNSGLSDEISLYSGGGYSTIPDSFGASQGTPLS